MIFVHDSHTHTRTHFLHYIYIYIDTHTHILHFIIFYLEVYGYDDVASFERVGDNMGRIHQLIN